MSSVILTKVVRVRPEVVTDLREVRFWSPEELADAAGLPVRAVERLERGRLARYDVVVALAKALRVEAKALINDGTAAAGELDAASATIPTATSMPSPASPPPKSTQVHRARRLESGDALATLIAESDLLAADGTDTRFVDVAQELRDLAFVWGDLDEAERADETDRCTELLAELATASCGLYANRRHVAWESQDKRFRTRLLLVTLLVRPLEERDGAFLDEIFFEDAGEENPKLLI